MRCHIRESSAQLEGVSVGEQKHTVRSVMTVPAFSRSIVEGSDDVVILEGNSLGNLNKGTPSNSRVHRIIGNTARNLSADIYYAYVCSQSHLNS